MLDIISVQLRRQRRKTLFIALALLLGALYQSFSLPEPGNQILVDYVRNDDLDIVLLRTIGGFFSALAIVGYIAHINRELFPERYERGRRTHMAEVSDRNSD
jgi:hypothetical protein